MDDLDADLTSGERLLLCGLRLMAADAGRHTLQSNFEAACGCAGPQAFRALQVFVQQLGLHSRRRIVVAPPAAAPPTGDEALVLEVFGCAQVDDYAGMDLRLARLIGREPPASLGGAACVVAESFGLGGLMLRARDNAARATTPLKAVAGLA
jgi:hypothetical protein